MNGNSTAFLPIPVEQVTPLKLIWGDFKSVSLREWKCKCCLNSNELMPNNFKERVTWSHSTAKWSKSQITSDLKSRSPNRKNFPYRCLGQLKLHFHIARFVIWTSVNKIHIAVRIAMPISNTTSQTNELFWEGSHCLKSLVICDSRFESQIAIAIKSCDLEHLAPR